MNDPYVGSELELFSGARHWKAYFSRILEPYIGARILEVGAGIGSNTAYLATPRVREWTSLEPDGLLACRIAARQACDESAFAWTVIAGMIAALDPTARFDTILYIDVLEHIADDRAELAIAAQHLGANGHLIVLAPAHQFLFSPFDANIGHFRRYNRASLIALTPSGCRLRGCFMLDSAGFCASLANRVLLRASMPTARQIALWDKVLVPVSRILDWLTGYNLGKSVVAVWDGPS
jgi:SAM-dependent methyltransferase